MKYNSKSEKDTYQIAANLARKLKGGEIIALEGDLGAGKTTFTQYLAKALGVKQHVTSPTFVLMKIYEIRNKKYGIRNLVHVDCYRLDEPQELFYLGLEEYLNKPDSLVAIEWADKIKDYLKDFKKVIWLKIKIKGKQREIEWVKS
jgi:tRNA threonylcarbamoyladenosine biosynthesis protein TsaE